MINQDEFNSIFFPRHVAVIGASLEEPFTKAMMLTAMKDHLYAVNPYYKELMGKKFYASVLDIEGPVDYVILSVPGKLVLKMVAECIQKGVKVVHSFTSGFSETGLAEGIRMEKDLAELIKGKIRLLGPNCMGIYCPKSGLTFNPASTNEEGHIGVISQSGTFAGSFIDAGRSRDIKISKLVSYGNAVDLDCPDFLQYLADDVDTEIIALYIEGIKDGQRLMQTLKYSAKKKPVFVLKGGITDQGGRVASSHTGSMAGSSRIWDAVFRQSGVVQVDSIDDLINVCEIFNRSPLPDGNGVSIITYSGGFSVVQSDMCARAGLDVPRFSDDAIKRLREFVPVSGTIIGNPLDAWQVFYRYEDHDNAISEVFDIVASEKDIHSLILQFDQIQLLMNIWENEFEQRFESIAKKILAACKYVKDKKKKPVIISIGLDPMAENSVGRTRSLEFKKRCMDEGIPVLASLDATVNTVALLYKYVTLKQRTG